MKHEDKNSIRNNASYVKKIVFMLSIFYGCICLFLGCKEKKQTNTTLTFIDDAQQSHHFKKYPKRVISLVPSITEILYAIGAGDKLIAVTENCNYPEAAQKHPKKLVVYPNVSTEQVLALNPDLILTSTEVMSIKVIEQFKPYNIPVFFTNYTSIKDIPRSIYVFGKLLDVEQKAKFIADSIKKAIENYDKQKILKRPKIWLVIGTQPMYTAGKNSFMNDIIYLAGGKNIAESITNTAYPILTREFVLSQRPEYIIVSASQKKKIRETLLSLYPEMKVLPCLQDTSKIIGVEEDILVRPTTRSLQAIESIKRSLN